MNLTVISFEPTFHNKKDRRLNIYIYINLKKWKIKYMNCKIISFSNFFFVKLKTIYNLICFSGVLNGNLDSGSKD